MSVPKLSLRLDFVQIVYQLCYCSDASVFNVGEVKTRTISSSGLFEKSNFLGLFFPSKCK